MGVCLWPCVWACVCVYACTLLCNDDIVIMLVYIPSIALVHWYTWCVIKASGRVIDKNYF